MFETRFVFFFPGEVCPCRPVAGGGYYQEGYNVFLSHEDDGPPVSRDALDEFMNGNLHSPHLLQVFQADVHCRVKGNVVIIFTQHHGYRAPGVQL